MTIWCPIKNLLTSQLYCWFMLGRHACVQGQRFSHVRLFATPWTVARQAPLSVRFSRQEYWSGLPCPAPGDLPNPGDQTSVSCTGRQVLDHQHHLLSQNTLLPTTSHCLKFSHGFLCLFLVNSFRIHLFLTSNFVLGYTQLTHCCI